MLTAKQRLLPKFVGYEMALGSVDWWIRSEDLPDSGDNANRPREGSQLRPAL